MVLIALSLFGIVESSRLERTMKMGIGIGFLPFTMSLAMGVLSLVLLVGVLKGKIKITDKPIYEKGGALRVVAVVAILSAYIILIEGIGFVPSTYLFFCGTIFLLGQRRIVKTDQCGFHSLPLRRFPAMAEIAAPHRISGNLGEYKTCSKT